ncbi:hypothetical protein ACOSQ4_029123 [Xanthoceras sorbifolium]
MCLLQILSSTTGCPGQLSRTLTNPCSRNSGQPPAAGHQMFLQLPGFEPGSSQSNPELIPMRYHWATCWWLNSLLLSLCGSRAIFCKKNLEDDWLAASLNRSVDRLVYDLPSRGFLEIKCRFYYGDMTRAFP